jgi:glutaredoxin
MAIEFKHVSGKKKGEILLYALSTCGWCRKTKELLDSMGVAYDYVYVDRVTGAQADEVANELERLNPSVSFPTLCINKKNVIVGFKEDDIKGALKK